MTFLAIMAFVLVRMRNLFAVVMLSGIFSLLCAGLFVVMDAVDVAFTEAAVGAGISTVLMLGALNLTSSRSKKPGRLAIGPLLIVLATGATLIYATFDMPRYGTRNAPIHQHQLYQEYIYSSYQKIGVPNVVTSVLASYRGYDTMGEVTVIFTAGIGVLLLLGSAGRKSDGETGHEPPRWQQLRAGPPAPPVVAVKAAAQAEGVTTAQETRPPPTPPPTPPEPQAADEDDATEGADTASAEDDGADATKTPLAKANESDEPQAEANDQDDAPAAEATNSAAPQADDKAQEKAQDSDDDKVVAKAEAKPSDKGASKVGPAQSAKTDSGAKSSKSKKSKKSKKKKKKKKGKKGRRLERAAKEGMA